MEASTSPTAIQPSVVAGTVRGIRPPDREANQVVPNEKSDSTKGDGGEQLEATTQERGVRARASDGQSCYFWGLCAIPPSASFSATYASNNLKGITVEFPAAGALGHYRPIGPRGKARSRSTRLYAEGQRRYIESLSTYAKQFLERMPKPWSMRWRGCSPAVAIEQKNPTTSSRSTVGTATEIADSCDCCGRGRGRRSACNAAADVKRDTVQEVVDSVIADFGMRKAELPVLVHSPTRICQRPGVEIAAQLRAAGFVRAQVDGELVRLDDEGAEQRVRAGKDVS